MTIYSNFEERFFELVISNKPAFVLAKNITEAYKKVSLIDPITHSHFIKFIEIYKDLQDEALLLSDWSEEYASEFLISKEERIKCFYESMLRVFLEKDKIDAEREISWMIIKLTDDIIEARNEELLVNKRKN